MSRNTSPLPPIWTNRELRWNTWKEQFISLMKAVYNKEYSSYSRIVEQYPELILDSLLVFGNESIPIYALRWTSSFHSDIILSDTKIDQITSIEEINQEIDKIRTQEPTYPVTKIVTFANGSDNWTAEQYVQQRQYWNKKASEKKE